MNPPVCAECKHALRSPGIPMRLSRCLRPRPERTAVQDIVTGEWSTPRARHCTEERSLSARGPSYCGVAGLYFEKAEEHPPAAPAPLIWTDKLPERKHKNNRVTRELVRPFLITVTLMVALTLAAVFLIVRWPL